jgi:hypothetical protein
MLVGSQGLWAQTKKPEVVNPGTQPSSLSPNNYPTTSKSAERDKKKRLKVKTKKITYNARDNFYDRMEQVAKENRKAEKELQKPQYSDPAYFGHKRPPKRRPNGKLKYCKECGIRH